MLRITMQDSPESVTFLVEGKLVGEWAKELEQCYKQTSSVRGHRALIIDLSETLFIDQEGRRVLATLDIPAAWAGKRLIVRAYASVGTAESLGFLTFQVEGREK